MKNLIMIVFLLMVFGCGPKSKVVFTSEEEAWLKAHDQYERSMATSDYAKLKIKKVVSAELALMHDLDDLANEMNNKYKDSLGVEVSFSGPIDIPLNGPVQIKLITPDVF